MSNKLTVSLYIMNLEEHERGRDIGVWLNLPATQEQIENAVHKLGFSGMVDAEYYISMINSPSPTIGGLIPQTARLDRVNQFVTLLKSLPKAKLNEFVSEARQGRYIDFNDKIALAESMAHGAAAPEQLTGGGKKTRKKRTPPGPGAR